MSGRRVLYGGDYNPEQWLDMPQILEKDLEYMKESGINTVTMGMFAWSVLEPEEGDYRLDWLEEIVDRLYENGISTIMGTPSGARPKWLADRYPEVLRTAENRTRYLYGGRHNHCYTSPVYRDKVAKLDTELAKRFGNHPAVILWHISNEFGGECHCPLCQKAFRDWLEREYREIDELNRRWCTTFWSHRYQSFDQIESPCSIGESALHGLNLDWKRFVTEQTADFAEMEIRALRAAGAAAPVTTNFMYDYTGLNYDRLAKSVDVISWDSYPLWHKREDILTARDNGFQHDYMRSLKHSPFLLMESSPSGTNWQGVTKLKRPGLLTAASLQALAHGSDSVLYFQIRQSRGASEKFHGAVIDHYGGRDTRIFGEVKALGRTLEALGEILGSQVKAEAAVIYDVENRWALEDSQGPRNDGLHYHETVMKSYSALKKLGINVDVISESQELAGYRMVVGPMLYLFRDGVEQRIRDYVAAGGCFVMTCWSGIVDRTDCCYLGKTPHGLTDVFGVRRAETDGLFDWEENQLLPDERGPLSGAYRCGTLCDLLEAQETANVLMRYGKEFYRQTPAVVQNRFGEGTACYVGSDGEQSFYDDLYRILARESGITPLLAGTIPQGIEVCSRESSGAEYIFIQNFRDEPVDISSIRWEADCLWGEIRRGKLDGYGTVILKREKQ